MKFPLVYLLPCLFLAFPALAVELTPALTTESLDLAQCKAFDGARELGAPPSGMLEALLGIQPLPKTRPEWTTGKLTGKDRHFRIAFKQPVAIGTVCTTYTGPQPSSLFLAADTTQVSYLKADAPAPGDVSKNEQWVVLPAGPVKVLPPGVQTRALRFTHRVANVNKMEITSTFTPVMLLKERYYSALAAGGKKVNPGMVGKSNEIWTGFWNEQKVVVGLIFLPTNALVAQVEILKSDATLHPVIAPEEQWKRLKDMAGATGPTVFRIDKPIPTSGIRLTALQGYYDNNFPLVCPLVNLGDAPVPPALRVPPPPSKFNYAMPMDGFVAIDITDKRGKHVRRLVAETPRAKGQIAEAWDLKDDNGQYVLPGVYSWHGIARPPLKLTYEITVNNGGQPAWWAPVPGKGGGGWLGDHGSPISACAVGDVMFLGDTCAESGHAAIATDLEGNKLWGEGAVLEGFAGADRITSDGRYAYLCNSFGVQRVDPKAKFATKTVLKFNYTRDVPGAGRWWNPLNGGAAVFGDKLYVSFYAPPAPWLQSSFISDVVDVAKCFPMPRLARGKRNMGPNTSYMEGEYDELEKLYASLLTENMPEVTQSLPRAGIPSSTQAFFGDAPTEGPLSGTLTVAFKTPVAIGSILLPDASVKVYALKPGQKLPDTEPAEGVEPDVLGGGEVLGDDPFSEDAWIPLPTSVKAGQPAVALAPEGGMKTQALRFKTSRLQFALVLSRRFKDVAPQAERVFAEGTATPRGGWDVKRDPQTPINSNNPAVMALVWKGTVNLRGLSLIMPTGATTAVDYWVGPADGDPKAALADDANWKQAGIIEQEVYNGYWPQAQTERNLDFDANITTRAIRLRAIAPEGTVGPVGIRSAVNKTHIAGFGAVVVYSYLGADPPLPPSYSERVTEVQLPADDKSEGKVLRHFPLTKPGFLAFNKAGTLYAVSDGRIVTVPLDGQGEPKVVITADKLQKPAGLAFDAEGLLYVADWGPMAVKVFDVKTGKLVRTIGTPGGPQLGPWDPARMDNPTGIAIDSNGKLWIAENSYQPKRISRWSRDGKVEKWFLGPTGYGGGGYLDPGDKSVLNYNGMKFVIDWAKRTWKLDSRLFRQGVKGSLCASKPDRAIYVQGRRYLAGDPGGGNYDVTTPVAVICRERNGIAVPLVAAGNLAAWGDVELHPDLKKAFGNLQRQNYGFCWVDKNSDGVPQLAEVKTTKKDALRSAYFSSKIGDDLTMNFTGARLRPTGFSADGTPQYDLDKLEIVPELTNAAWSTADGRTFTLGDTLYAPDGKTKLWEYPDNYPSVHGSHRIGWERPAGVLVGEHQVVGHFTIGEEELFVTNGNHGDWFAFTKDGLLAACIFGGPGSYGKRSWTMPEWVPGKTDLSDLNVGEEHFWGYVTKANDGKVYAVAGHNHNSVVRVDGLEAMKRLAGSLAVSKADLEKTQAWEVDRAAVERIAQDPKVGKVPYLDGGLAIDGSLDDWEPSLFQTINEVRNDTGKVVDYAYGALAFDADKLFIAARASDASPMLNSAADPQLLFKYGDALDVQLGLDPAADPARKGPVVGDLRLLITRLKGEPVIVLYRPVVPGGSAEHVPFKSPVGETWIDVVKVIDGAEIEIKTTLNGWVVEAAIPWKALGVDAPRIGSKLRGDLGVLQSDQNGVITVNRLYWAGKTQNIVSDIPTEARLSPALWGDLFFIEAEKTMLRGPEKDDMMP